MSVKHRPWVWSIGGERHLGTTDGTDDRWSCLVNKNVGSFTSLVPPEAKFCTGLFLVTPKLQMWFTSPPLDETVFILSQEAQQKGSWQASVARLETLASQAIVYFRKYSWGRVVHLAA